MFTKNRALQPNFDSIPDLQYLARLGSGVNGGRIQFMMQVVNVVKPADDAGGVCAKMRRKGGKEADPLMPSPIIDVIG